MWLYAYSEISYFLVILANNWSIIFATSYCNKSSAVAEMGDRLATINGPKSGEGMLWGRWSPLDHHLTQCGLGQGLPLYQVASWSVQPFGHKCRNTTLLHVRIPLPTIFIRSLVVTRQNIYSTCALSNCSMPNKIKQIMFYNYPGNILNCAKFTR